MIKLTISEIMNLAGVYTSDSDLERDLKITQWIAARKYAVTTDITCADQEVEILIIKEM